MKEIQIGEDLVRPSIWFATGNGLKMHNRKEKNIWIQQKIKLTTLFLPKAKKRPLIILPVKYGLT